MIGAFLSLTFYTLQINYAKTKPIKHNFFEKKKRKEKRKSQFNPSLVGVKNSTPLQKLWST